MLHLWRWTQTNTYVGGNLLLTSVDSSNKIKLKDLNVIPVVSITTFLQRVQWENSHAMMVDVLIQVRNAIKIMIVTTKVTKRIVVRHHTTDSGNIQLIFEIDFD